MSWIRDVHRKCRPLPLSAVWTARGLCGCGLLVAAAAVFGPRLWGCGPSVNLGLGSGGAFSAVLSNAATFPLAVWWLSAVAFVLPWAFFSARASLVVSLYALGLLLGWAVPLDYGLSPTASPAWDSFLFGAACTLLFGATLPGLDYWIRWEFPACCHASPSRPAAGWASQAALVGGWVFLCVALLSPAWFTGARSPVPMPMGILLLRDFSRAAENLPVARFWRHHWWWYWYCAGLLAGLWRTLLPGDPASPVLRAMRRWLSVGLLQPLIASVVLATYPTDGITYVGTIALVPGSILVGLAVWMPRRGKATLVGDPLWPSQL